MLQIQNITNDAYQRHSILYEEYEIVFTLRYLHRCSIWIMNLEYIDWKVSGIKLSVGVPHILGQNQAFDFFVSDETGNGIDPYKQDDFSIGRCNVYMLEREDLEDIRGVTLP